MIVPGYQALVVLMYAPDLAHVQDVMGLGDPSLPVVNRDPGQGRARSTAAIPVTAGTIAGDAPPNARWTRTVGLQHLGLGQA